MFEKTSKNVIEFISKCPSCFHAVNELSKMLDEAGFTHLKECEKWDLKRGGKYYTQETVLPLSHLTRSARLTIITSRLLLPIATHLILKLKNVQKLKARAIMLS